MVFRNFSIENRVANGGSHGLFAALFSRVVRAFFRAFLRAGRANSLLCEHAFGIGFYSTKRVFAIFVATRFDTSFVSSGR